MMSSLGRTLGWSTGWLLLASCATTGRHSPQPRLGPAELPVATSDTKFVQGEHVRAVWSVLEARKNDASLTTGERNLDNIDVYVTEVEGGYEVRVLPRPDAGGSAGGATEYGREIVYIVRKLGFAIVNSYQAK